MHSEGHCWLFAACLQYLCWYPVEGAVTTVPVVRSVCMVQYKHTGYTCVYRRNTGVAGPWEWIVCTFCLLLGAAPYFRSAYVSMPIRILQFSQSGSGSGISSPLFHISIFLKSY